MPSKKRILKKTNWAYLLPQLGVFLLITMAFYVLQVHRYWLLAISTYLLLSAYLKIVVPKWHRKGLFYLRKGELEGAAFAFTKSYSFFSKYSWIDSYRAFTLLSISALSYREMALMNMFYCYNQLGKKKEASSAKNQLKKEFPNNPFIDS